MFYVKNVKNVTKRDKNITSKEKNVFHIYALYTISWCMAWCMQMEGSSFRPFSISHQVATL